MELEGFELSAFQLSFYTLLALRKKGVLTPIEAKEVAEQALLALEEFEAKADPQSLPSFRAARAILDGFLGFLSREES